jgi:hypothetical protein
MILGVHHWRPGPHGRTSLAGTSITPRLFQAARGGPRRSRMRRSALTGPPPWRRSPTRRSQITGIRARAGSDSNSTESARYTDHCPRATMARWVARGSTAVRPIAPAGGGPPPEERSHDQQQPDHLEPEPRRLEPTPRPGSIRARGRSCQRYQDRFRQPEDEGGHPDAPGGDVEDPPVGSHDCLSERMTGVGGKRSSFVAPKGGRSKSVPSSCCRRP